MTSASVSVSVRTASLTDKDRAIATLLLAFSTDPMVRWLYPDPGQFVANFPEIVRLFGGAAFEHGTAYCTDGHVGAALWLPPGVHPDLEGMGAMLMEGLLEARHDEVFGVMGQMDQYHPHEEHWYLPLIGVDPVQQGKGIGSALLSHALAECDRQHLPAYLESSNPRNIPLYERHGFEAIGKIQSAESPVITPMLRKAR